MSLFITSAASAQGTTSAAITGFVTDKSGAPVAGATITAVHVPSGSRYVTTTRGGGQYTLDGIRPGGPYTVTISGSGFATQDTNNVQLDVGGSAPINFVVSSDIVKMEAVTVESSSDTTFNSNKMASGLSYNPQQISQLESVRQDVQDIANMDPRAVLQQSANGDENYTLSVQGQNPRSNLVLIDGVSATDNFGLNSNGYAGLRNPLPLVWIESFAFELNQYDLVYGNYSGGILDATLKSGTNEFHGSLYEYYTGTNFRGPDPVPGALGPHEKVQSHTSGGTLGGPIIKDKLFFFVGYEAFREIAQPPAQELNFNDNASDTATINQIIAHAEALGDTNPGSFFAPIHTWQRNFVGKIDWNISDAHKFEITFRHNDGQSPLVYNYTYSNETSLNGSWYDSHRVDQSYTAKLNSDWGALVPGLKTELEATYKRYNGSAVLEGPNGPAVTIYTQNAAGQTLGTSSGGSTFNEFFLGPSPNYQNNKLFTSESEEHAFAEYSLGSHTFKFGAQFDRVQLLNAFIPNYYGSYTFSNVQDYLNSTPTGVTIVAPAPGFTVASAIAHYSQLEITPLLEDIWKPTPALTLLAGVRMDYPYEEGVPPQNPTFASAYAGTNYNNQATINGHYTVSPRFGFNYTLPTERKTQIHGGAGLFLGQAALVWLENSFSTAGQLSTYTISNSSTPIAGYTYTGNPATQALPPVAAGNPVPSVDFIANNLHQPANWKENIAIDHELPFWHLVLTGNIDLTQVQKDLYYTETNLATATSGPAYMPDGAIRYAGNITPTNIGSAYFIPGYTTSNFYTNSTSTGSTALEANPKLGATYELNNTDKGGSQEYTVMISRPLRDNWAFSLGYSHTHATQVYTLGGTTASGSYGDNFYVNPNDNIAYRSVYASPDKVTASLTRRFHFIPVKNAATTISAQFIAQTGEAYSYTFKGDADGSGLSGNSLFYVPTGPSDPKVTWASASEEAAFFGTYLPQHPDLEKYAGEIAPRNAFYSPWAKTVNLHVEQEVPLYWRAHVILFADCFNFANLLNKNWGVVQNFGAYNDQGGHTTVAGTGYNPLGNGGAGQYIYTYNAGTVSTPTIYSDESRWMIQVGARLEF